MKRTILSFAALVAGIWAIAASQQGDFNTYKYEKTADDGFDNYNCPVFI